MSTTTLPSPSRRAALSALAMLAAAQYLPSMAQAAEMSAQLSGRWDLTLMRRDGDFQTVWLFENTVDNKLSVATIGPNPIGLSLSALTFTGTQFSFTGTSALGATTITGNIDGGIISGKWESGQETGELTAKKRSDSRQLPLLNLFDRTMMLLEASLFTASRFNDEWQAAKLKTRETITSTTIERELILRIRQLLATLKLSHMGFYALPATAASIATPDEMNLVFESRMLPDGIAYLKIKSFAEGETYRTALDIIFTGYKNNTALKGLVLDLRGNSGGSLNLAMRLGDYFYQTKQTLGVFATRAGLNKFTVGDIAAIDISKVTGFDGYGLNDFQQALKREGAISIASGGRSNAPFSLPVAAIQNERCASTTEALLATLKETKRARLFGIKTAGAMLSSAELPVADGYVLRLAFADFRPVNGKSLEAVGVTPDEAVENGLFGDRVLDRAVRWIKG